MPYSIIISNKADFNYWLLLPLLFVLLLPQEGASQELSKGWIELHSGGGGALVVPLYKSKVLKLNRPAKRVTVGNPEIADILILGSTQIYVLGKALGSTNIVIMDKTGRIITTIDLEVGHDLEALKTRLYQLFPDEDILVHSSQGSIILSGQVSNIGKIAAAVELAESFLPLSRGLEKTKGEEELKGNKIINLMEVSGAQQVMIEVKVAEISRQLMRKFDMNFNMMIPGAELKFGAVSGGATFPDALFAPNDVRVPVFPLEPGPPFGTPIGPMVDEFLPNDLSIEDKGLFLSYLNDNLLFNVVLDIAKENGLAKILAEPTLTALTGQEAKFISGGEFPIPVPARDGDITIEFKEFGVGLQFLPVVLDSDRINLKLNITVSDVTDAGSVIVGSGNATSKFFVPALTKRSVNSTVELDNGQTLGIAGLINENLRETLNKFPGLGDVPMLGALFRSQEFVKGQTELVIFVTPHFARPIAPELIRLPTDDFVEPSDAEFYLMGRLEGEQPKADTADLLPEKGGAEGSFGHEL